jgi:hypothetical protein
MPVVRRWRVDLALDGEQGVDAAHNFDPNRRFRQLGQLEQLASTVGPAGRFAYGTGFARCGTQTVIAAIGVRLHETAVACKVGLGVLGLARGRVVEQHTREDI